MKCHYEVLEISKDAGVDDLKKAYRKLALKWHPDKNPDNVDEAKREFILVQQAYEVLIDPQERAWYDRHRDSILKGAGSGYEDESLDVFPYFSVSCFRGYDDSNNGFYTIYREVFNKLAAEESEYLTEDDLTPPEFGKSDSSYDLVSKFYGYWSSFCTKKSYSWLNTYDINEAENRRILRLMEQENKRVRERAKKERNEEIRALVAFVRKRDKRVAQYAEYLKQKTAENNKKAEEHRKKMIAEHHKNIASYKESEWSKFSNLEKELKEIESTIASEFNDQSDDSDDDGLFCVACNKYFKTFKSFGNHEKSKKHKENVAVLKTTMIDEENLLNGASPNSEELEEDANIDKQNDPILDAEFVDELSSEEERPKKKNKSKKNKRASKIHSDDDQPMDDESPKKKNKSKKNKNKQASKIESDLEESLDELVEEELPKKKNKSKKNKGKPAFKIESDVEESLDELVEEEISKKKNKSKKNRKQPRKAPSEDELSIDSADQSVDDLSEEELSKKKNKKNKKKQSIKVLSDDEHIDLTELGGSKKQRKKLEREKLLSQKQTPAEPPSETVQDLNPEPSKSTKKKDRKKRQDEEPHEKEVKSKLTKNIKVKNLDSSDKNKLTNGHDLRDLDVNHECATCNQSFDSKNKLFQHLNTSGHSILLPNKGKSSKAKKKK